MATPSSSSSLPSFAAALPTTRKPRSPVAGVLPGPKVETCLRVRAVLSADRWAHPQSARKHASADEGSYVKWKPLWSEARSGVNAPIGNRQVADGVL